MLEIGTVDADLKACWTKEPNSLLRGHSPTTEQIACDVYAAKTRYKYLGFGTLYSSSWNAKGLGGEVCPIVKEINLTCGVDGSETIMRSTRFTCGCPFLEKDTFSNLG